MLQLLSEHGRGAPSAAGGRLLAFGALVLIAVGGWLSFLRLRGLPYVLSRRPYVDVIYFAMGHTSTWWSVMCLFLGSGAAVLTVGLLLHSVLGTVRNRLARIGFGAAEHQALRNTINRLCRRVAHGVR